MSLNKKVKRIEKLAADVARNYWESYWRNYWCRRAKKQPLQPGQKGRTHKRKPRGTRKRWYRRCGWEKMRRSNPEMYKYLIGRVDESSVKR